MKTTKKDYVEVVYNEADKPFTTYPKKLATYLSSRFNIKKDCKILELGCGRGELLNSFIDLGIEFDDFQNTSSKENIRLTQYFFNQINNNELILIYMIYHI